jgi:hypothetical protein
MVWGGQGVSICHIGNPWSGNALMVWGGQERQERQKLLGSSDFIHIRLNMCIIFTKTWNLNQSQEYFTCWHMASILLFYFLLQAVHACPAEFVHPECCPVTSFLPCSWHPVIMDSSSRVLPAGMDPHATALTTNTELVPPIAQWHVIRSTFGSVCITCRPTLTLASPLEEVYIW